jgi:outer membrane protein TolC
MTVAWIVAIALAINGGDGAPANSTTPVAVGDASLLPIDLGSAWRLAGVNNPTIAAAREAINERLAEQLQAQSLLLPTANAGANVRVHGGNLMRARGNILDVDSQSVYLGGGAGAIGASTVAFPGIQLFSHLGDAIFEPLVARQRTAGARFDAVATERNILLQVALRYLELAASEARVEAYRLAQVDVGEVARLTQAFAKAGQGRQADAERAQSEQAHIDTLKIDAEGRFAIASARLAELLNLDPSVRLQSESTEFSTLPLFPEGASLDALIEQGLRSRPELASRTTGVAAASIRLRESRLKPLLPVLSVGYSGGGFAGGSNMTAPQFGNLGGRSDFDVYAVWTLQNFGVGDIANSRRRRAELGQTEADRKRTADQVRREVVEAFSDFAAARRQQEIVVRRYESAEAGMKEDLLRIRGGIGRPLEILNSVTRLSEARQARIDAVLSFNSAQFRLFVAIGDRAPFPSSRERQRPQDHH